MHLTLNIFLRLILAIVLGSIVGLERELSNKQAGLKTNLLVCFGSCIFTILSIYAFPLAADSVHPQAFGDPARIAAQILTGIGFIGGGTVLRHGSSVFGLTTAATLWIEAAIGMACGTGMFELAILSSLTCVTALVGIRYIKANMFAQFSKHIKQIKIILDCDSENANSIHNHIISNVEQIHKITKAKNENEQYRIIAFVDANAYDVQALYDTLGKIEGILSLTIQEDDE